MTIRSKWIEFLYRVATGSRKLRNFFTPVGAIFYGLLIFSFVVVALQVDRLLGISAIFPRSLSIILALPVFLIALFLLGWSILNFFKSKGTPVPFNPPPHLVTTGPYAYVRNPMLSGVFALLFGLGVLLGSASLLVVFTPLFILINVWELKVIEEPELIKRLGDDYLEYRKRTPMFFPHFRIIFKRHK
ncbi:MAG: isoprenylcysteine carboxylmethyltransferase family protein [Desulfobacterales bacterium]